MHKRDLIRGLSPRKVPVDARQFLFQSLCGRASRPVRPVVVERVLGAGGGGEGVHRLLDQQGLKGREWLEGSRRRDGAREDCLQRMITRLPLIRGRTGGRPTIS
jgi:hypothetical protein